MVSTADRRAGGNIFVALGILASAFGIFFVVLHGAQSFAVKGPALSPSGFSAIQKTRYRIVLRGRIDHPLTLSFRSKDEQTISSEIVLQPRLPGPDMGQAKTLIARVASAESRLVVLGGFDGEIELRAIDQHAPLRKWCAAALLLAVVVWFCFAHWRRPWVRAFALGVTYFLFLLPWDLPGSFAFSSDNRYYVPTSMSLLQSGDWNVDEFGGSNLAESFKGDYRVRQGKDGHWFNLFPPGVAVLSLPIVLLDDWLHDQIPDPFERAALVSATVAKIFSAVTVAFFFLLVRALTNRLAVAWTVALVFAFVTPQLGTHAGGLWSHNASVLCATLALCLWVWKNGRFSAFAALPLAIGFASRPTIFNVGIVFAAALFLRDRKQFSIFALLSCLCAAVFVFHSLSLWGAILPPYYSGHARGDVANGASAYFGTLFSPNRGLFVYCPVLLLAFLGVREAWRRRRSEIIYLLAALIVVLEWIVASRNGLWWGGHCYGPRLLCELLPFATLLLIPAWEWIERGRWRTGFLIFGFLACAWGVFVQAQALANPQVYHWNATPDIDDHPARLWDWRDMQIFAR